MKLKLYLLITLLIASCSLNAEESEKPRPFWIAAEIDAAGKATIEKKGFRDQHLIYGLGHVELGAIYYYNPCYTEGAGVVLGYTVAKLSWKQNPYFNQTYFNTVNISINGFTKRARGWLWKGELTFNLDAQHTNYNLYANYDCVLWGRYEYSRNWGLHVGLWIETGMKIDRVYPIIGFDWQINSKWKLNMVFPCEMALEYNFVKNLTAYAGACFFDTRNRSGKHEPVPFSLYEYRTFNFEGGLKYENEWIEANIHGGSVIDGQLILSNRQHKDKRHFPLGSAIYGGGRIAVKF